MEKEPKGQNAIEITDESQVVAFADILAKVETDGYRASQSLKGIERNTSVLPRLVSLLAKGAVGPVKKVQGYHEKAKQAATRQRDERGRFAPSAIATARPALPQSTAVNPVLKVNAPTPSLPVAPVKKTQLPASSKAKINTPQSIPPAAIKQATKAERRQQIKPDSKVAPVKTATLATPSVAASPAIITAAEKKRDNKGRFQPKAEKSVGQLAQEKTQADKKDGDQAKTIGAQIKDALKGGANHLLSAGKDKVQELDTTEAAGRAAGGPIFDAARELQGAAADIKKNAEDDSTLTGKAWKFVQSKRGKGIDSSKQDSTAGNATASQNKPAVGRNEQGRFASSVTSELKTEDKKDDKRHKELIKVIAGSKKKEKSSDASSPLNRRNIRLPRGGGIRPPSIGPEGGAGLAGMLSGLTSMIGPAIAVAVAAAAGAAIGTGLSKALDYGAQKLTGDKNATAGGAAYDLLHGKDVKGVRDVIGQVESGDKGYKAYQNKDSGIVSYGKYQFTAANGKDSGLAKVLDNYSGGGGANAAEAQKYSQIIKAGGAGAQALRGDKGFKDFLDKSSGEKAMQDAQEKTFDQSYFNPAMGYAQRQGINVAKMPKLAGMMVDTKIQGGMEDVTQRTKSRLAAQGKDFKTASEDEILNVFTDERKQCLDRVANDKASKGDVATADMLRNSKGRVDVVKNTLNKNEDKLKENAFEMAQAARKDQPGKTAATPAVSNPSDFDAQKAAFLAAEQGVPQPDSPKTATPTPSSKTKKGKKGEKSVDKTPPPAPVTASVPEDKPAELTGSAQKSAASIETPGEVRTGIGSEKDRAELRKLAGVTPVGFPDTKPAETVAAISPAIQPAEATKIESASAAPTQTAKRAPQRIKTAESIKTPPPAPVTASVPEVGQLAQAMQEKKAPQVQQEPSGNAVPMIRTEFDDTMLTLMAYDRV